ncbi:MAG: hypothetical protein WD690_16745 [Vicinamibacterales bacterium]
MKLFEHRDFEQLVLRANEHFKPRGLRPAIVEKDYYVTETLRIIAASKDRVIFFLDPRAFNPVLGNLRGKAICHSRQGGIAQT